MWARNDRRAGARFFPLAFRSARLAWLSGSPRERVWLEPDSGSPRERVWLEPAAWWPPGRDDAWRIGAVGPTVRGGARGARRAGAGPTLGPNGFAISGQAGAKPPANIAPLANSCDPRTEICDRALREALGRSAFSLPASTKASAPAAQGSDAALEERIRGTIIESTGVTWKQVKGNVEAVAEISTIVREPLDHPETGIQWTGILLYGPPGTGKTTIAKAIASEAAPAKFLSVSAADVGGSLVSESERLMKAVFGVARQEAPTIVFLDEIDSILGRRSSGGDYGSQASRKVLTQFLIETEGLGKGAQGQVLVIGATNNPWDLDDAVLSRLRHRYYIGLPSTEERRALIDASLATSKPAQVASEVRCPYVLDQMALWTRGRSGRDLVGLVESAKIKALVRSRRAKAPLKIVPGDLLDALKGTGRPTSLSDLDKYEAWSVEHGLEPTQILVDKQNFIPLDRPRPTSLSCKPPPPPAPAPGARVAGAAVWRTARAVLRSTAAM
jgi:AAA+ superfamily predicted ATPase